MYQIEALLRLMVDWNASDLYVSLGAYPMLKISGETVPLEDTKVSPEILTSLKKEMLTDEQIKLYGRANELDFSYSYPGVGRFRVNFFRQRGSDAFVVRRIVTKIKTCEELNLPSVLKNLVEMERGLILVVGATGSGKSTTLAAMVDHRNATTAGHILTLEDPIEFLHYHKKSIVNQREIGQDSSSYHRALKSALREAPSMLLIGEIRDRDTMSAALNFSETGHLVLSTLHATNAPLTIERVLSFYDTPSQDLIRLQLSQNIQGIIAQRLVPTLDGGRVAALELLLPTARVRDLINKADFHLLHNTIEGSNSEGMQSFDQALYRLYSEGTISQEQAIWFADRQTDLKMLIRSEQDHKYTESIELTWDDEEIQGD